MAGDGSDRAVRNPALKVLLIVRSAFSPVTGGSDLRSASVAKNLAALGVEVFVFCVSDHFEGGPSGAWVGRPDGHPVDEEWTPRVATALALLLDAVDPDIAILEQLFTCPALVILGNHRCRVVLNTHNVEGPLAADLVGMVNGPGDPVRRLAASRISARELATLDAVDEVWACSRRDAETLAELTATPVCFVPNVVQLPPRTALKRVEHQLLFVGSLTYVPNLDAVEILLATMPRLRAVMADATLVIAGSSAPRLLVERVAGPSWCLLQSDPESVTDALATAAALVVPLRVGGGSRFKVLEAFAANLPVISTCKGVEGLDVRPGTHFLEANTAEELISAVRALRVAPELGARLAERAFDFVRQSHSDDTLLAILKERVV